MIILPSGDALPNNPRIGWANIVPDCTLAATGEALGFPVSNLANPATYLPWKGNDATGKTISITPDASTAVTYLGIARHNLTGVQYTLQSSPDDATWTTIAQATPSDNAPIFHVFEEADAPYFRLVLGAGSVAASIGVLYLGAVLTLERRIHVGHTPIQLGRAREVSSGISESGQYLGRVLRSETFETSVSLQNLTADHFYDELDPFLDAAAVTPFFWARRPTGRPDEVVFGWMQGDAKVENQRNNGMMQVSWKMQGIR
jgi:hypothetical protein